MYERTCTLRKTFTNVEHTLYMAMCLAVLLAFNEVQEYVDPDALKLLY